MIELIRTYSFVPVDAKGRTYACAAYGKRRARGGWEGQVVFFPLDGGEAVATDRETSQPRRAYLSYWAGGLTAAFLQGALTRALSRRTGGRRAVQRRTPAVLPRKPAGGSLFSISLGAVPQAEPGEQEEDRIADALAAFAIDLTERARRGEFDPLIGRDAELERVIHVLCRRRKNNPVLVGDAGTGKTAIVEGLALAIVKRRVPARLKKATLYSLDMGRLVAGTKLRGQFEERMTAVIAAIARDPNAILFIDEIHTIVSAGASADTTLDASNLLKPALATGLRCIGSTTFPEYRASIENDRALGRRFQKIDIREPSVDETVRILEGLRSRYEKYHRVRYCDEALRAAAELSVRYLRDRKLPDKAIDLLDEAGAAKRMSRGAARKELVGVSEIEAIVAKMADVPARAVSISDQQRLAELEPALKQVIFGQDTAVEALVAAIKLARAGLRPPDRTIGSFLFSGPTGVGKTELAKQLARVLGVAFLRFDMSEYMEKHMVSRLIGAPPGYIGFEQGGQLTDGVRKTPHAVLLLDEIDKAHPDVSNILLQVMDHATLTDHFGQEADFRHVILILTTNAGARELSATPVGFGRESTVPSTAARSKSAIEQTFSPEFRNRLDALIAFDPLTPAAIKRIVDCQLGELALQLAEKHIRLRPSDDARAWLATRGFDPAFGARPMARLIQDRIATPLADAILFGPLQRGGAVRVEVEQGQLQVAVSESA